MQIVFPPPHLNFGMSRCIFAVQSLLRRIAAPTAVPCWDLFAGKFVIFNTVRGLTARISLLAGEAIMIKLLACVCPDVGCPIFGLGEMEGLQRHFLHGSVLWSLCS